MENDELEPVTALPVPDNLEELLRQAAKKDLTLDELRAQRISFAVGMMPDDSTMTRRDIEELLKKRYG